MMYFSTPFVLFIFLSAKYVRRRAEMEIFIRSTEYIIWYTTGVILVYGSVPFIFFVSPDMLICHWLQECVEFMEWEIEILWRFSWDMFSSLLFTICIYT